MVFFIITKYKFFIILQIKSMHGPNMYPNQPHGQPQMMHGHGHPNQPQMMQGHQGHHPQMMPGQHGHHPPQMHPHH